MFPSPARPVKVILTFLALLICCVLFGACFGWLGSVLGAPTMFAECQVSSVHIGLDACFKTNALVCMSFRFQSLAAWVVWIFGGAFQLYNILYIY